MKKYWEKDTQDEWIAFWKGFKKGAEFSPEKTKLIADMQIKKIKKSMAQDKKD